MMRDVPVHVDLCRVNAELLLSYPDDHGERLVDLKQRDVVNLEVGPLESLGQCDGRSDREVDGVETGVRVGYALASVTVRCL